MNRHRPDRRDPLLHDLYRADDAALPSLMARRIRRRRSLRQAGVACVLLVAAVAFFRASHPSRETAPALAATPRTETVAPASAVPTATDAELLTHLQHERVIIFTLADGRREVVWLDGRPQG